MTLDMQLSEEILFNYATWALQENIWDGRHIAEISPEFLSELQTKITSYLFSKHPDSFDFHQTAAQLACLGSLTEQDIEEIKQDLIERGFHQQAIVLQAGLKKSVNKFWKKHKTEILIGVGVAVVITAVAVGILCSGGAAAQPALAAGGALLNNITDSDKEEKPIQKTPQSIKIESPSIFQEAFPSKQLVTPEPQIKSAFQDFMLQRLYDSSPYTQNFFPWNSPAEFPYYKDRPIFQDIIPLEDQKWNNPSQSTALQGEPILPPISLPEMISSSLSKKQWLIEVLKTKCKQLLSSENIPPLPPFPVSERIRHLGDPNSPHRIGGINGINNSSEDATSIFNLFIDLAPNETIDWVYNRSNSILVDILEAAYNFTGHSPITKDLLVKNWTEFHEMHKDNPHMKYLQISHSQGTIQVKNALNSVPEEIRQRVISRAFAPATIIPKDLCYDALNYMSSGFDFVPQLELWMKSFAEGTNDEFSDHYKYLWDLYFQVIILEKHPDAPIFDHSINSPTYRPTIKDEIIDYLKNNGTYQ